MKSPIYDYSHNQSLYLRLVIHFFSDSAKAKLIGSTMADSCSNLGEYNLKKLSKLLKMIDRWPITMNHWKHLWLDHQVVTYTAAISACHNVSESLAALAARIAQRNTVICPAWLVGRPSVDPFFTSRYHEQPMNRLFGHLRNQQEDRLWNLIKYLKFSISFFCIRCEPNSILWTPRWKVALHLLHEKRLKEVSPNTATYNSVPRNKSEQVRVTEIS